MRKILNNKGFTLIEIIVAITILTIILAMIGTTVTFFTRFFRDENSQVSRQENMRLLLVYLEKDIRMSNQSVDFSGVCYIIGTDVVDARQSTYCVSGTEVSRNGFVVARDIDNFALTIDGDAIDIFIQAEADERGTVIEVVSRVFLRKGQGDD